MRALFQRLMSSNMRFTGPQGLGIASTPSARALFHAGPGSHPFSRAAARLRLRENAEGCSSPTLILPGTGSLPMAEWRDRAIREPRNRYSAAVARSLGSARPHQFLNDMPPCGALLHGRRASLCVRTPRGGTSENCVKADVNLASRLTQHVRSIWDLMPGPEEIHQVTGRLGQRAAD